MPLIIDPTFNCQEQQRYFVLIKQHRICQTWVKNEGMCVKAKTLNIYVGTKNLKGWKVKGKF